jgi:hypothetical protein
LIGVPALITATPHILCMLVKTIAGSNSTSGRQAGVVADQLAAAAGKDRRAFDTASYRHGEYLLLQLRLKLLLEL